MENKEEKKIKRSGLGKGLSALLSDVTIPVHPQQVSESDSAILSTASIGSIVNIPIENIETNPYQPRTHFDQVQLQELAESIKIHGIIQPITVRKLGFDKYQLIAGERRLQSVKLIGIKQIPSYVRAANDQSTLEMALIENIHRSDLNPIEISMSFKRLVDECQITLEELGNRVGKERSTVNNYLRLLKLPPEIQIGLRDNLVSMGHARALITLEHIDQQLTIYKECVSKGLSVRQVEKMVQDLQGNGTKKASIKTKMKELDYDMKRIQSQLSSHFGTRVSISSESSGKGHIQIPFFSMEDFNRLLEIIEP